MRFILGCDAIQTYNMDQARSKPVLKGGFMLRVLITGGAGGLGHEVVTSLRSSSYTIRIMSRRPRPSDADPAIEWMQADLATGAGLAEAVADVHTIIHAATHSPLSSGNLSDLLRHPETVDVQGTQSLIERAHTAGVAHIVYVSIVGIDQVPLSYYANKLKAEALIRSGSLPWSILRATQFHTLIDQMLRQCFRLPIAVVPAGYTFQPIDTREVAARLHACVENEPAGQLPDFGGPEVRSIESLAQAWLQVQGRKRRFIRLWLPGKAAAATRSGGLTCPEHKDGSITWEHWLEETYGGKAR